MIKNSQKTGHVEDFLNLIKDIYKKPTANIIFNSEILEAFSQRSSTRQECSSSPDLFNIVLEVLAKAIWQEREIRRQKYWEGINRTVYSQVT